MSEEKVTLELVGARLTALTAELRDVQQRVGVLEARFTAMEAPLYRVFLGNRFAP